jgi:hypothetical protein
MKSNLVELRKQAEQAVRDMAEGDLKVKAFETILTHLLSSNSGHNNTEPAGGNGNVAGSGKSHLKQKEPVSELPKSVGKRILFLKADGFFASQKSIAEIRSELKKNGWHYPVTSMSGPLQKLVQKRQLRRQRADEAEGRKGWKYSNP